MRVIWGSCAILMIFLPLFPLSPSVPQSYPFLVYLLHLYNYYIFNLTNLQVLYVAHNLLSRKVPDNAHELQYLWLDSNLLYSTLPSALANCSSLVHLSEEDYALRGAKRYHPGNYWSYSKASGAIVFYHLTICIELKHNKNNL
jgi:hypothetical protein